jgi:hypothetical protein
VFSSRVLDLACVNVVSDQFKAVQISILSKIVKLISRLLALLAKKLMEKVTVCRLKRR